jgi:hypothetical protein
MVERQLPKLHTRVRSNLRLHIAAGDIALTGPLRASALELTFWALGYQLLLRVVRYQPSTTDLSGYSNTLRAGIRQALTFAERHQWLLSGDTNCKKKIFFFAVITSG